MLREKRVTLVADWDDRAAAEESAEGDPFALRLLTLMLVNKADRMADVGAGLGFA